MAEDYLIVDPWDGQVKSFKAKYGDPSKYIFGLRLYSGPVSIGGETIESLIAQVKNLSEKLAVEIKSNAELREKLVKFQGDLVEADKQNGQLIEENRKLVMKNEQLSLNIIKLDKDISIHQKTVEGLKERLKVLETQSVEGLTSWQLMELSIKKLLGRR